MPSIKERLRLLSAYVETMRPEMTTFIVAGGNEFHTLMTAGGISDSVRRIHPGRTRIVLYPHPVEGVDALSLSLYQMIDEAVEVGKLEFPELESDEL